MHKSTLGNGDKKNSPQFSNDDLDATHKQKSQENQVFFLSRKVQKKMLPVTSISSQQIDEEALRKLNEKYNNLIIDTNQLAEQVKKLSASKVPLKKRYENAKHKVPLIPLKPTLDPIIEANNKKFFFVFEDALDNTAIIDAYPHEATLFKVAVLYKLFLNEDPSPRVIEMSIAIREDNLSDRFKYIEEQTLTRKANAFEMAQQAYIEIINSSDKESKQRFETSYEKFKKMYCGLWESKPINADRLSIDEQIFPEIPDSLLLQENVKEGIAQKNHVIPKQSNRDYFIFTGNELTTLEFLIPEHKKNSVYIPGIGGIALDSVMRTCLSKQTSIANESSDIRKRNARERFILKVQTVLSKARGVMDGNKLDYDDGFSGHATDPKVIKEEVDKALEVYQKQMIIDNDCKLSGAKLSDAFFEKAIKLLKLAL